MTSKYISGHVKVKHENLTKGSATLGGFLGGQPASFPKVIDLNFKADFFKVQIPASSIAPIKLDYIYLHNYSLYALQEWYFIDLIILPLAVF